MRTLLTSPSSLDNSSCMRKYGFEKIVGAAPIQQPAHLDKGDLLHVMLASYYREEMKGELSRELRVEKAIDEGRRRVIALDLDIEVAEDEVIHAFRDYSLFWQNDNHHPVAVEQEVVEVLYEQPDSDGEEGLRVIIQMLVDVIFENSQGHKTWTDHKSRSRNQEPSPLTNQFQAYAFLSGSNRSMRNNIGFQKTLSADKKFTRDSFFYPKSVLEDWRDWTVYRAQYIDACIKSDNFPPDFTKCDSYGGCWFKDVCMQAPGQRENFLNVNFVKRKRKVSIYEVRK